jgi:predicted MFS family arabinose efflux permease
MSSAFGARHAHDAFSRLGEKRCYLLLIVPGIVFMLFGLVSSWLLIPLIFVHALIWGMSTPLLLERINRQTGSDVRATALSVNAMAGRILYITGAPLFGFFTDHRSLSTAFLLMAVGYLLSIPALLAVSMRGRNPG